jgi:hypothetical protein
VAAVSLLVASCGSNPASPGAQTVSQFLATVMTAAGGATAVQESGSPPAASGGPSVTVTGSSTVTDGGLTVVNVQGGTPFQTVFVSVGGTGSSVGGFYKLQLPAPTTSTDLVQGVATAIPVSSFQAVYSVATGSGAVGPSASITTTVQSTAPSVSVTGTWIGTVSLTGNPAKSLTLTLTETGVQVTGSFTVAAGSSAQVTGSFFGAVAGTTFTFASPQFPNTDGCTQQISNGTAQVSGTTMQGTATVTVIGSCGNAGDFGTLTFTVTKQ